MTEEYSRQEIAELAKSAAVYAMSKISDKSVEYSIATRGTGQGFEVIVHKRPEEQINERRKRKKLGESLF